MTLRASGKNRKDYFICEKCHFIGHGEVVTRGSKIMETIMWSVFLIPGPFYSLWRHVTRYLICPKCKSTDLISLETLEGKILFNRTLGNK